MRHGRAFTLIELLVVILIIGVLASVSFHMMRGAKTRAIISEAVVGLSRILQAQQQYYLENGAYFSTTGFLNNPNIYKALEIGPNELDGTYFSQSCYYPAFIPSVMICFLDYSSNPNTAPCSEETIRLGKDGMACVRWNRSTKRISTYAIPDSGYCNDTEF